MALNWQGNVEGSIQGAGAGSAFGGWGALIGAGVGGTIGLFSKKPKKPGTIPPLDISGELAKLDALYAEQGSLLKQATMEDIARAQKQTAAGLAGRGILSSPVSQKAVGEVSRQGLLALARGQADILSQKAGARTAALSNLMKYNTDIQLRNYNAALENYNQSIQNRQGLTAMGAGALMSNLGRRSAAPAGGGAYADYPMLGTGYGGSLYGAAGQPTNTGHLTGMGGSGYIGGGGYGGSYGPNTLVGLGGLNIPDYLKR